MFMLLSGRFSVFMKLQTVLLILTSSLGTGLLAAVLFLLPLPIKVPSLPRTYLPAAQDRDLPESVEKASVTLSFVGDIMMARNVEATIVSKGSDWPLGQLGDLFEGSDFVIGNLEGTVRPTRSIEVTNQMTFDTTPDNLQILKEAGFTHLSLSNNHTDDYGSQVAIDTRNYVKEYGMTPFGDPFRSEQFIVRENINGLSLSFVGFHAFNETTEELLKAIAREDEQGRFVIVYPHWGPEYVYPAPIAETYPAQQFINAGADLIVGAHPHIIQNVEVIGDVPVIYSLGNFLFDQEWSAETSRGMTVQITITEEAIDLDFTPVSIKTRQTTPMMSAESQELFHDYNLGDGTLHVVRE